MSTLKFISVLSLFLTSCHHTDKTTKDIPNSSDSSSNLKRRTINNIDTTFYKSLGKGFYKTPNGDIYELKKYIAEDSLGFYDTYFLDSTLVYGEYSNRKPLKDYFDIDTYSEDTVSNFSKDRNHVYYTRAQSDGHIRFIVENADVKTFEALKGRWGKDKRHIFYEAEIVKDADIKTFQVYKNSNDSAKDKKHLYCCGEMVK